MVAPKGRAAVTQVIAHMISAAIDLHARGSAQRTCRGVPGHRTIDFLCVRGVCRSKRQTSTRSPPSGSSSMTTTRRTRRACRGSFLLCSLQHLGSSSSCSLESRAHTPFFGRESPAQQLDGPGVTKFNGSMALSLHCRYEPLATQFRRAMGEDGHMRIHPQEYEPLPTVADERVRDLQRPASQDLLRPQRGTSDTATRSPHQRRRRLSEDTASSDANVLTFTTTHQIKINVLLDGMDPKKVRAV